VWEFLRLRIGGNWIERDDDQVCASGEQAGPNEAGSVLRVSHPRGATCSGGRNCAKVLSPPGQPSQCSSAALFSLFMISDLVDLLDCCTL
jgi:hypothetical protein